MEPVSRLTVMGSALFNVSAITASFDIAYANEEFCRWLGTTDPTFQILCDVGRFDPAEMKREVLGIINSGRTITRVTKWPDGLWYVEGTPSHMLGKPVALYYAFRLDKMHDAINQFFVSYEQTKQCR